MTSYTSVMAVGFGLVTIICIGYICRIRGAIATTVVAPLNMFIFKICLPVLIGRSIVSQNLSEISFMPFLIASLMSIVTFVFFCLLLLLKKEDRFGFYLETVLPTIYISYAISGIPFFNAVWPGGDLSVVSLMVIANDVVPGPIFIFLAGYYQSIRKSKDNEDLQRVNHFQVIGKTLFNVIKNPVVIGVICGFIYSATGLKKITFLDILLKYIGDSTVPLALFNVGIFLAGHSFIACSWFQFFLCLITRFIIGPAITAVLCHWFRLSSTLSRQCIIICAQPTAVSAYVLAESSGIKSGPSSTAILWTNVFAVPAVVLWFVFLDACGFFVE